MKYAYEPTLLKAWIRDNRHSFVPPKVENATDKFKGTLEKLEEKFTSVQHADPGSFESWFNRLERREKLLLPNLYREDLPEYLKQNIIKVTHQNAKADRRLFRVMVDVVYQTCNLDEMWNILKYSYAIHHERIQKRLEKEEALKWKDFLLSQDPVHHLATIAYEGDKPFLEELETFYLNENFPLFKLVLMDVLGFADEDFFIQEKQLYANYFKQSTNEEQQKMAENLIKNCNLNNVKDLGKLIFEKLKTYRRKPMLWRDVGEEEKKRFHQWILRLELKDFFSQVNQSHERFVYWKKFIHKLEDAVVTDEKKTLIMYFSDIVIMEVLGTGAVYAYDVPTFQRHFQPRIDRMLQEQEQYANHPYMRAREVKRHELMNKDFIHEGGWLSHRGGWQDTFDYWLNSRLGWEVDEHVLQEEAERMEHDLNTDS